MLALVEESFQMRNDPDQLSVNSRTMKKLARLHPCTLSEKKNSRGPIAWVLVVPTSGKIMEDFLAGNITEKELLKRTPYNIKYDALYLCSALVLPEYRRKRFASRMLIKAVKAIQKDHPIQDLFGWIFSPEGKRLAVSIAQATALPVHIRNR
jgi:hypothetical protein